MIIGLIFCFLPLILFFILASMIFKQSVSKLLLAVLFGLIAVFPISVIQFFIPDLAFLQNNPVLKSLISSFFIFGFIEELFKMLFLLFIPKNQLSLFDFFIIALIAGLSLGCFESVIYFLDRLQSSYSMGGQLLFVQIFERIFTADIVHMCCAGLSGLFVYSLSQKKSFVFPFIAAILIHGIFDFFAGFNTTLHYFSFAAILLSIIECRSHYTKILSHYNENT